MSKFEPFAVLAVAIVLVRLASAQTVSNPELRILDFTNSGSTSACIGKPVTPLCAVETYAACYLRTEWPLCAEVGYEPGKMRRWIAAGEARLWYYRYEILGTRTSEADDIPNWASERGPKAWQPGDVAVRLWWEGCPPYDRCVVESREDPSRKFGEGCRVFDRCGRTPSPLTYIVRPIGRRWRWVDDEDEAERPNFYGTFWNRK